MMNTLGTKTTRWRVFDVLPLYLILNAIFVLINVVTITLVKQWIETKDIHCPRIPHFGNAFPHSYIVYNESESRPNPFAGFNHTSELTEQWTRLLASGFIRMSADEGKTLGILEADSVRLGNGDVVASLNVFQEMDCIKWLKMDLFNPESSEYGSETERKMLDRCVNIILQQRLCRLDLSMESWYWKDQDYSTPWPRPQSKRLCMNWEQLEDWLLERQVLNHGLLDEPVYRREGPVHVDKFFTSVVFV